MADGLPVNIEAERCVLGAALIDEKAFDLIDFGPEAFSLDKHRKIFKRMLDLRERGERVDRITVANELMADGELESCDGLSYLISLDDGIPKDFDVSAYARIVKEKAALRRLVMLGQKITNSAISETFPSHKIVQDLSSFVSNTQIGRKQNTFSSIQEAVESYGGVTKFAGGAIDPGPGFGFQGMNDHMLGLQAGCQYVIAGRTSSGKSALSTNIAVSLGKRGVEVAILGIEMGKDVTIARMACAEAYLPLKWYMRKEFTEEQQAKFTHAVMDLSGLPIYIDDCPRLTITEMSRKIRDVVREKKVRVVIVDHLHRVNWRGDHELNLRSEYDGVTAASWACCLCARELGISTVVLCQLSRPADRRKADAPPTLDDLRASGAIEFDATGVAMLHRPELFSDDKEELKGVAELYIRKSRNGSVGMVKMRFRGYCARFEEDTEHHAEED